MNKNTCLLLFLALGFAGGLTAAAPAAKAPRKDIPYPFFWAEPDALRGDWAGTGGFVAQVIRADDKPLSTIGLLPTAADVGKYEAHIYRQFDVRHDTPVAILQGVSGDDLVVTFAGDGWTGTIADGHFRAQKGAVRFDLQRITRTPPTMGAKPPAGAIVLFDGTNLDAWAKRGPGMGWLEEDGPPTWKLVGNGAMEIAPNFGSLISHKWLTDFHLHLEFRTLGGPTNTGIYLLSRYEINFNEMYGRLDGNACSQFDNCTEKVSNPGIRCSRPPLEWQTVDVDFQAARFDANGVKIADARATVYFNGVLYYDNQVLGPLKANAARIGEGPSGPLVLQDHSMPAQYRNIWLVEKSGPAN